MARTPLLRRLQALSRLAEDTQDTDLDLQQAIAAQHSRRSVLKGMGLAGMAAAGASLPGVAGVHDLHIWPMSTTETALTAHLLMPGGHPGDAFLREIAEELEHHHRIGHTTVQVEQSAAHCETVCRA